ncbi:MAG: hypothetical protein GC180_02240 [Bacteroidetes bacterium]|nr:hypothetical protein [Bacteroidota bacterium]
MIAADQPNASKHDIEHSQWYSGVHKLVLSNSLKGQSFPNTEIISGDITRRMHEIKQIDGPEILVFGSPGATHSLIRQDLIDGYWLFLNPVVLGEGIPLFTGIQKKINLNLSPITRQFSNGVTELNYSVNRT